MGIVSNVICRSGVLAKVFVRFLKSHTYLTGVAADKLAAATAVKYKRGIQ